MSANAGALKRGISGSTSDIPLRSVQAEPAARRERRASTATTLDGGVLRDLETPSRVRVETRGPHVRPSIMRSHSQAASQQLAHSDESTTQNCSTRSAARVIADSATSWLSPHNVREWAWNAFVTAARFFASERTHVKGVDSLHVLAALNSSLPRQQRALASTFAQRVWQPVETMKALPAALRNWTGSAANAALGTMGSAAATLFHSDPATIDAALRKGMSALLTSGFTTLHTSRAASDILKRIDSPTAPIATFWAAYSELDSEVVVRDGALLSRLDELADTEDKRLTALALAFAFEGVPGTVRDESVWMEALDRLQSKQLIDDVIRWIDCGGNQSEINQSETFALKVLCVFAARSDEFPDVLRLLGHDVGDGVLNERTARLEERTELFRALLQAHAALCGITPQSSATRRPATHADESGNLQTEFARNVRDASVLCLTGHDDKLTVGQETDLWVWLNRRHDVSKRQELAASLAVFVDVFGAGDDDRSPLSALHFGLGGANYGRLPDEMARVTKLPDTALVKALVQALHHAIQDRLFNINDDILGEAAADMERARLIAELVALGIWMPDARQGRKLEVNDIVRGRAYDLSKPNTIEAEQLEQWCTRALESAAGISSDARASLVPEINVGRMQALSKRAGDALAAVSMSLLRMGDLAAEYGISDGDLARYAGGAHIDPLAKFMDQKRGVIQGVNTKPTEEGIEGAVQLLHDFCSGLQSGNSITLTHYEKGGVKTDGVAVNIAGKVGLGDAGHRHILGRLQLGGDRARATELQVGLSTDGARIIAGRRTTVRGHGGVGAHYGRSWGPDDHPGLGRIAGGVDVAPYTGEESVLEGPVLRYPRRVVRMNLEASPPVYEHNESDVRKRLEPLQAKLREIALVVRAEQRRAAQAGEAFDVGEAVLRLLAPFGRKTGLSIALGRYKTTVHQAQLKLAAGASVTTSQDIGMRAGVNANVAGKYIRTGFAQREDGGLLNVAITSDSAVMRVERAASAGPNLIFGAGGTPPVDLVNHSALLGEMGESTQARCVKLSGRIQPSASYTQAGFRGKGYAPYLQAHREELIEAFSFAVGGDKVAASAEFDKHLRAAKAVHSMSHDNSLRSRMNESFADALNRLRGLLDLVPRRRGSEKFIAELERKCARLVQDEELTRRDSAIVFSPLEESQAIGQTVAGVSWAKGLSRLSMRELMLYRPGWNWLRFGEKQTAARVGPSGEIVRMRRHTREAAG